MQDDQRVNGQLGFEVARLRAEAGLSQADLAARLSDQLGKNIDPTTITRLERGRRPVTVTELLALAGIFEVLPVMLLPEGMPLQSWLARWQNIRGHRGHDLTAAHQGVEKAEQRLNEALEQVQAFQTLTEFQRTQVLDTRVVAAVELVGQVFRRTEDLQSVLVDAGVDEAIVIKAIAEVDEALTMDGKRATDWARCAFVAAAVSKVLARDATP